MAGLLLLARALLAVSVVQPLMLRAFLVTTVAASGGLAMGIATGTSVIEPVLLLQLFGSATGFAVPARRGHYDLVLTRGESRWRIGVTHWALSAAPGVACWLVLAGVEALADRKALRSSGTVIAMLLLSTLPWAANTRLPRLTAAIAWLVAGGLLASVMPQGAPAVVGLVRPWTLGGAEWTGVEGMVAWGAAVALAAAGVAAAVAWIARMDVPLESAQ